MENRNEEKWEKMGKDYITRHVPPVSTLILQYLLYLLPASRGLSLGQGLPVAVSFGRAAQT